MSKPATLVFPHQLFENHPAIRCEWPVFLLEEHLFFQQYPFHKQKLAFHRASMKFYQRHLESRGVTVIYIDAVDHKSDVRYLLPDLLQQGISELHYCDVTDNWVAKRLLQAAVGIRLIEYETPLFLNKKADLAAYFQNKNRFFQTDFYIRQRKQRRILVDNNLQPMGGKWSFDAENRLRYPKDKSPPTITFPGSDAYWEEACNYVEDHFSHCHGHLSNQPTYPANYHQSRAWLQQFLNQRFAEFGAYEDAIVGREHFLHHSGLTPMLNVGLLTPTEVLNATLEFVQKNSIPINSLEGFIRQVIGWREFIRGVYDYAGTQERNRNFWGFTRKIPDSFWQGTTGIAPFDIVIEKVLRTGYCHHIERLMVLGNFMLLCEFDPNEVYRWFMTLFIDAYDWVMVPNVYGMSQFADGGLMATKPYLSGSNYLLKMGDFAKGDWQAIWDALFWRFLYTHRDFFQTNPRLGMLIRTFDNMAADKRERHLRIAESYLAGIDPK